jgi:CRISPR-associated protein Csb2
MSLHLLITVRLHDGRYYGSGGGPPSPARLFQALVAGAGLGGPLRLKEFELSLRWLERLAHPTVGIPHTVDGQGFRNFVPNNDFDAIGGDMRRVGKIRTIKPIKPRLFNSGAPFLYGWTFEADEDAERQARGICDLADRLYQFGRGVDMAWAVGEVLDTEQLKARLSNYAGVVYRPSKAGPGKTLACPKPGSLDSLMERYAAGSRRFTSVGIGKAAKQLFSQPPKPRFAQIGYDSPTSRRLYDLREATSEVSFEPWPLAEAARLVTLVRDLAVDRLRSAFPDCTSEIERVVVGRKADGSDDGPIELRVRIIPLPSIGHHYADHQIRRVLIEVPPDCPFRAEDLHWTFSGLELVDRESGEILFILTPATDESMLKHYGAADRSGSRVWRTVTPAALPESARRRRIDPTNLSAEAKDGPERAAEQARAASAVVQALRHAGVRRTRAEVIRVQREPFEARGERVEMFAPGTRFAKERLWHVEIALNEPIAGPLTIGDGRFLGLGVMAPVQRQPGILAFAIEDGLTRTTEPTEITNALRRAVMARVQGVFGVRTRLPAFFSGHERDGSPAKEAQHPHLTFVFDAATDRLLILAPHVVDRRSPTRYEIRQLAALEEAMIEFRELRAGVVGCLMLRPTSIDPDADLLFARSRIWESMTRYQVTRHAKKVRADEALSADVRAECRRIGLPEPRVTSGDLEGVAGIGLVGRARLTFQVAVSGPIVLGRSRHLGGGLFARAAT